MPQGDLVAVTCTWSQPLNHVTLSSRNCKHAPEETAGVPSSPGQDCPRVGWGYILTPKEGGCTLGEAPWVGAPLDEGSPALLNAPL